MQTMTERLRELLRGPGLIRSANVWDPLTARIAVSAGFTTVGLAGFAVGAVRCVTEPTLNMTEMFDVARLIARSVRVPLRVDCGAGFGEPIHVMRTVREAEAAGIACISLEDQHFPKRAHYHKGIEAVIPAEEMVDKIKAAIEARTDPNFVIIGRTDTFRTHGISEAIRRANLYIEAGCDMIAAYPRNYEEAKLLPKEIAAPLKYTNSPGNRHGRPVLTYKELEDFGYRMTSDAQLSLLASVMAVKDAMNFVQQEGRFPDNLAANTELRSWLESLIGLDEYYRLEERTTVPGKAGKAAAAH
jgi:methylisocitrate lyase